MRKKGPSLWRSTRLSKRMPTAERDDHLESQSAGPQATEGQRAMDRRNGSSRETMLTGTSKVTLDIPRDRAGTFAPKLIARYQRRFPEFEPPDRVDGRAGHDGA